MDSDAPLQLQLDELRAERDAALAREAALAEVLTVINRSPGDLARVFDIIGAKAIELCDAAFGGVMLPNGDRFRAVALGGVPEAYAEFCRSSPDYGAPTPGSLPDQMLAGAEVVHVADVADSDGYRGKRVATRALVELGGGRTLLGVALRKDGKLLGMITIFRQEVRLFSDRQVELLRGFAAQAVIAMENARLLTEQREALEQQTATAEVLQVINASPGNLAPVFDAILEKAHSLCGAAMGALATYDGTHFRAVATRGYSVRHDGVIRQPFLPNVHHQALLGGERITHIADVRALEAEQSAITRSVIDNTDMHTCLTVPLRNDGAMLGFISAWRREVRSFSDKEIALLENFAAQAVIAMENARLLDELREALEQQTATAEVLQVINASPGNLAPVFEAVLEKAIRLCESEFGIFNFYDGECFHAAATRGVGPDLTDYLRDPIHPSPGLALYRIVQGENVVHVADITDDEAYRLGDPGRRAVADLGGARSQLMVALRKDGTLLGAINIFRQEVRPFSDKQVALVQNFAAQAVIAMENARLITETREALEQQTATAEVLQVINASPGNLAPVFEAVLDRAMRLCEAAFGGLAAFDGERFTLAAIQGVPVAYAEYRSRNPFSDAPGTLIGHLRNGTSVLHITDLKETEVYRNGDPDRRAIVDIGGARSSIGVALRKDAVLLGAIQIYRQEVRPFSDRQIALLENFAAQAVIAMENARLINEQREALEQQTATAEVLQVINASPGNLKPVFNALLEKAMRLCAAKFGELYRFDGVFRPLALLGLPPAYAAFKQGPEAEEGISDPRSMAARTIAGEAIVHVVDLMDSDAYRRGNPSRRAMVDLGGARTAISVALRKDNVLRGGMVIYRQEVRPFTDKQIALLENFAAQAVIAMDNARLLEQLRARTEELAQRQAELRITFENMGDGVALYDEGSRLVAWNRKFQEIFNVPDSLLEQHGTFADHIRYLAERGDYGPGVDPEEQVRRLAANASEYHAYERTRPDGRVIEIRHNPVPDGGFVLIFSDITERKRSEAEIRAARDAAEAAYRELKATQANLIQAEKMASLGQLTAGIAHEIKNPLNFVNNFSILSVELLDEMKQAVAGALPLLDADKRGEIDEVVGLLTSNLEKITEHGRRADGIVRSMLEHSRGGSGDRRSVDLNTLVDEALNLAYHGARAQDQSFNITLERDFATGIAPIVLVPQDMTRVFLNLFSNGFYAARKRQQLETATAFEPTLTVTTRDLGDAVEIRVRDNGIGIATEIRDKLFQPFFTTKPTGEGTGLGLSISYDIVTQQHGGTITVDSQAGVYTEFTIHLPRDR